MKFGEWGQNLCGDICRFSLFLLHHVVYIQFYCHMLPYRCRHSNQPPSNLKSHQCQMSDVKCSWIAPTRRFFQTLPDCIVLPSSHRVTLTKNFSVQCDWLLYQQSVKFSPSLCKCIFRSYWHELKPADVCEVENQSESTCYRGNNMRCP